MVKMKYLKAVPLLLLNACSTMVTSSDQAKMQHSKNRPNTTAAVQNIGALRTQPVGAAPASTAAPSSGQRTTAQSAQYRMVSDTPEAKKIFLAAQKAYQAAPSSTESATKVSNYLRDYPEGQYADEAGLMMARYHLSKEDPETAASYLDMVLTFNPPSLQRGVAYFELARCHAQKGRNKEALDTLAKIDMREIPQAKKPQVFGFWSEQAIDQGRWLEGTLAKVKQYRELTDPAAQAQVRESVAQQIETRLGESELAFILKEYPHEFPSDEIYLRLANIRLAAGNKDDALGFAKQVLAKSASGTLLHKKASILINRIQTLGDISNRKVGVLVPMSGDGESVGRLIKDGFELGLSEARKKDPQFIEVSYADAGPSAETALAAFERLVFEEKVMMVWGPVSASQSELIATKAAELGVPYVTFSQRSSLVQKGNSIFRLAPTPESQVRALVNYSIEKLKAKHFAILYPEDNFGKEFADAYFKVVEEKGGLITAAESYPKNQSDFRVQIENMVGTGFPAHRKTEKAQDLELQEQKLGRVLTPKELNQYNLKPIIDFDVLFLPDTSKAIGQMVSAFYFADVTTAPFMGPSTWNNPQLLVRAGQYLEGAMFVDLFSTEQTTPAAKKFVMQYRANYGQAPNSIAALGYDAALTSKTLFLTGQPRSHEDLRRRLEQLGKIDGALGNLNWDERREALTEMQLFKVSRGAFKYEAAVPAVDVKN